MKMPVAVTFGEIMMRLTTPGFQRFGQAQAYSTTFGGGEANVAVALAQLGQPARHLTCFPDNDLGRAAAAFFRQQGVDMAHTVFKGPRLGLYFMEVGAGMRPSRIIYDRSGSAFSDLDPNSFDWPQLLHDAGWFHWTGITPAISAPAADALALALNAAQQLGIPISADVNYRRNLWQYGRAAQEVMPTLTAHCQVLVCTEGDAADLFGLTTASFADMAEQLLELFPRAQSIIATRRETISATHNRLTGLAYTRSGGLIETPTYTLDPIVDRIGGGDAFAAGYIYAKMQAMAEPAALHFATVCAALKHLVEGDFTQHRLEEIQLILDGDTSGRLLR